ncbi:armadillo-type protein [Gymnopilus junonius]|uniref:Armadillo-type protein n=1 Tax=Gymnopilus junonius TaxID=109634 RepID=A0A9P5NPF6_GYMJU|nr:armadillo-type protein [Gymnopilus junonius]
MDVPYHSSGAMSRAHFAIVRKVESAPLSHSADQHIFLEIQSVRARLSHPRLRLDDCKECLVILLYCSLSVTPGFLPKTAFDFAFPHAINLAEAGRNVEDKRLGYLFCQELMPLESELRLMLVNTLRKDLESDDVAHICLALDSLISSPSEDVIPAVQSLLHDLLSHDYSSVRRRALLALRSLSAHDGALLDRICELILTMLQDSDDSVVKAALNVARHFVSFCCPACKRHPEDQVFRPSFTEGLVLAILECLVYLGLTDDNISILFYILLEVSSEKVQTLLSKAIILDVFKLLGRFKPTILMEVEKSKAVSLVQSVRRYLVSHEVDDVYFFMSCLGSIDVALWAGTNPEYPAMLDGLEFERIMQLLSSADQDIRRKTLAIINEVDPTILDVQLSLLSNANPAVGEQIPFAIRLLEIFSVRYEQDGEGYASQVIELTRRLDKGGGASPQVFKEVIEIVLNRIHTSVNAGFIESCANHFVRDLIDKDVVLGPTAFVVAAALTTEIAGSLAVTPSTLLSALALRLQSCPSIVREPCLIAMMRIRAEIDDVPLGVIEAVQVISKTTRRSISLRCSQFLDFVQNKADLVKVVNESFSSSLPDFLSSLQGYFHEQLKSTDATPQPSRSSSRASAVSASQLRYAAYDRPGAIPRLRMKKAGNSGRSSPSSLPGTLSDQNLAHNRQSQSTVAPVSAGDLALVEGLQSLRIEQDNQQSPLGMTEGTQSDAGVLDLINLESPHPTGALGRDECSSLYGGNRGFEALWNMFGEGGDLRGWCNLSMDRLLRRLQGVDQYMLGLLFLSGELKIVMISNETNINAVALRLRESEEDSCLWRLRCANPMVGGYIQTILNK